MPMLALWNRTTDRRRGCKLAKVIRRYEHNRGEGSVRERFDAPSELVLRVGGERIERVPEPALADEFERGAAHPAGEVELARPALQARL